MKNRRIVAQTFSLITQVGISIITPILLCIIVGVWLEKKFNIAITIPLIILGVVAGVRNAYVLLKQAGQKIADVKEED